jgi:hypothetical protein
MCSDYILGIHDELNREAVLTILRRIFSCAAKQKEHSPKIALAVWMEGWGGLH